MQRSANRARCSACECVRVSVTKRTPGTQSAFESLSWIFAAYRSSRLAVEAPWPIADAACSPFALLEPLQAVQVRSTLFKVSICLHVHDMVWLPCSPSRMRRAVWPASSAHRVIRTQQRLSGRCSIWYRECAYESCYIACRRSLPCAVAVTRVQANSQCMMWHSTSCGTRLPTACLVPSATLARRYCAA